jgi:hypothetical protein
MRSWPFIGRRQRDAVTTSALPRFVLIGDNFSMDSPKAPLGKSARIRRWFARHLVAIVATAIVLATLGWKNQYRFVCDFNPLPSETLGNCGWPWECVNRADDAVWYSTDPTFTPGSRYSVTSWRSLLLDAAVAVVSLIATWLLFSRTQRRCERWSQLSLASLFAFVMLAAVVCTVLKSESLWGC